MDGRGTGAEDTINRINRLQDKRISEGGDMPESPARNDFKGSITSTVPEEIKDYSDRDEPEVAEHRMFSDADRLTTLDVQYRTLFSEGGFEILRELGDGTRAFDPGDMGETDYTETLELLDFHGLIDAEGSVELTEEGQDMYDNWERFRQYLSSEERLDDVEEDIGEKRMPEFFETQGIEAGLDGYLRYGDGRSEWMGSHDADSELYDIASLLYTEGTDSLGQAIIDLEDVRNEDLEIEEFGERGMRGLTDEGLNTDGKKLYSSVMMDYVRLQW